MRDEPSTPPGTERHAFGPFELRFPELELYRDGRRLEVPPRSVAILRCLLRRRGELVSQRELLDTVWPGTHVTPSSLTEAISRLRAALGDDPRRARWIETLSGRGYRLRERSEASSPRRARRWILAGAAVAAVLLLAVALPIPRRAGGSDPPGELRSVVRLTPSGAFGEALELPPLDVRDLAISPDDRRIALTVGSREGSDIWLYESATRQLERVSEGGRNSEAIWSPDGRWLTWAAAQEGTFELVRRAVAGGPIERLASAPWDRYPEAWSVDGGELIFSEARDGGDLDLAVLTRAAGAQGWSARPIRATRYQEYLGRLSPDGEWLAWVSDRSGRWEVYVEHGRGEGEPVRLSRGGGTDPFWSADGAALYYRNRRGLVKAERTGNRWTPTRATAAPPGLDVVRIGPAADGGFLALARAGG